MVEIIQTGDMRRFFGNAEDVGTLSTLKAVNPHIRVWMADPTGVVSIGFLLPPRELGNSPLIPGGPYFLFCNDAGIWDLIILDAFSVPVAALGPGKCFECHLTDTGEWVFSTQKTFTRGTPAKLVRLPHIFGGRYWTGSLLFSKQPKEYDTYLKTWTTLGVSSVNTHADGGVVEHGTQAWIVGSLISPLNGFSHYDGSTQTWPASQPTAPSWLVNGSLCYVTGHGSGPTATVYVAGRTTTWGWYAVIGGSWTSISSTGTTLYGGSADTVDDAPIYLGASAAKWYECLLGNIVTESFSRLPIMPPSKRSGSGGHTKDGLIFRLAPGTDEFNRYSASWRTVTPYPGTSLQNPGCCALVPDDYLYAFSGEAASGGGTSWRYHKVTEVWESVTATTNPYDLISQQAVAGSNA